MSARPLHRRLEEVPLVAEPANDVELRTLLRVEDSAADLSITWVRIDGHHQRLRTDASTRLYQVLEGAGTITVGEEPLAVAAGDLVVIPPSTPYHLDGALTYLVLNQPGFRAGDDLYLDAADEVLGSEPPPRTMPGTPEV
ncbi:MAG: cupin domain-containing protein [Nitriliruptoraceae bacterium]